MKSKIQKNTLNQFGGEFVSKEFNFCCEKNGIRHQLHMLGHQLIIVLLLDKNHAIFKNVEARV
jgi:hypothetical protein